MNKLKAKRAGLKRRQTRVRSKLVGTAERPRLRVTRSNAHIYAQVVNDLEGKILAQASTLDSEVKASIKLGSNIDAAKIVGETVGKRALDAGIESVIFDRGGRIYHGRVKALAEGARDAGLKF
ncbi:MAG: 50S ribosomal protein L18 [Coriobacteriia bacterium]|nr:50S ribosomal protein L18 [Coriobacteriia bacterium]